MLNTCGLQGETLGGLGTGLDELMRHVPSLRESVIDVFIRILRLLTRLGGVLTAESALQKALIGPSADAQSDAPQSMETDSVPTQEEAGPSTSTAGDLLFFLLDQLRKPEPQNASLKLSLKRTRYLLSCISCDMMRRLSTAQRRVARRFAYRVWRRGWSAAR